MEKLTLEELKNAIREEEEKAHESEKLKDELTRAKIDTEKARAEKLRNDQKTTNQSQEPPKAKNGNMTTILFVVSLGATITATIAFFVLLLIKGRF